jgi:hypothetical protein
MCMWRAKVLPKCDRSLKPQAKAISVTERCAASGAASKRAA